MPTPPSRPAPPGGPEPTGEAPSVARAPVRPPPPMRVVTKGWWTLREETADVETLEREERARPE